MLYRDYLVCDPRDGKLAERITVKNHLDTHYGALTCTVCQILRGDLENFDALAGSFQGWYCTYVFSIRSKKFSYPDMVQLVRARADMSYIYVEGIPGRRCAPPARSVLIVPRCTSFIIFQFSPSAMVAPQRKPSYLRSAPPQPPHNGIANIKTL
jgi:hypothetical protein